MKIQLSETQLKRLLSERLEGADIALDKNQYLNSLLDKVSSEGYNSLSSEEKDDLLRLSKGEEVNDPNVEPEAKYDDGYGDANGGGDIAGIGSDEDEDIYNRPELDNDSYRMFFDLYPRDHEILVNGELWHCQAAGEGYPYLSINNNEHEIELLPFVDIDGEYLLRVKMGNITAQYKTSLVPQTEEEMYEFIDKMNNGGFSSMIGMILKVKEDHDRKGRNRR